MPQGILRKMKTEWSDGKPIQYSMRLGDEEFPLNRKIGQAIQLQHTGNIHCIECHRKIKKSYAQGYCYPCFISLAQTDTCIIKPHQCHHHMGTCRNNEFAEKNCFIPHLVYLAVSSGAKVGITRAHQKFTRWADQGASFATELAIVPNRKVSGELEVLLSEHIADKTNWRKMLSNDIPKTDLNLLKAELKAHIPTEFHEYFVEEPVYELMYPAEIFPAKISSYNLDKTPIIEDTLMGIKGQYLVFTDKVINMRKYQGYEIELTF